MRVVFILNSSGLYGANRSLLGLIRYLRAQSDKCFAIIPEPGDVEKEFKKLDIEYVVEQYRPCVWYPGYIGAPFLVNLVNLRKIIRQIKMWDVDLIHTNNSSHDIGMIAAKYLHKKHVWHIREIMEHNYNTRYIFPRFYRKLRAQSDAVICVSQFIYDYHSEHYPNANMKMIYNPYDVEYYNISRETFAPGEVVTILMAGALTAYKRPIDSVKAVKILVERGMENIKLILAGDGEKKYLDEIMDYIHSNHLEKWIVYMNFVPDLRKVRKEADIALCCSVDEALPRVIVEGMLGELLAIGADSGGISELIAHGKRGLAYEVGNCAALADQIEYAVAHREECRKMIENAKQYAIDNFELNHSGKKVVRVYNELIGNKGSK